MSKILVIVFTIVSFFSISHAIGDEKKYDDNKTAMKSVVAIQKSLAEDSLDNVEKHAKVLSHWVHETQLPGVNHEIVCKSLQRLTGKELKDVRDAFKQFNTELLIYLRAHPGKKQGYKEAYCSMAKAGWIQKGNVIANPYFGSAMLRCGSFKN